MTANSKFVKLKDGFSRVEISMGHCLNSGNVLKQISYLFPLRRQITFYRKGSKASEWIWYVNNRWDSEGRRTDGTLTVQGIEHFSFMLEKNVNDVTLASQCKVIRQTSPSDISDIKMTGMLFPSISFLLEIFQYLIGNETKIHI